MIALGRNIASLRIEQHLTQEQLAEKAGLKTSSILSRIERGETWISKDTAEKLAKALRVSVGQLFADTGDEPLHARGYTRVPVISDADTQHWNGSDNRPFPSDRYESVLVEMKLAGQCFAMRVRDEANVPEFRLDDMLVINPGIAPKPGKFVAADSEETGLIFRQYRLTSIARGSQTFELHPLNPSFPVISSTGTNLRILGTVVALHRKLT